MDYKTDLELLCIGEIILNKEYLDNTKNILYNIYNKNIADIIYNYLEKKTIKIVKVFYIERDYDFHSIFGSKESNKYEEFKQFKKLEQKKFFMNHLFEEKYNVIAYEHEKDITKKYYKENKINIIIINNILYNNIIANNNICEHIYKKTIRLKNNKEINIYNNSYNIREYNFNHIDITDLYWKNVDITPYFMCALNYLKENKYENKKIITYFC